MLIRRLLSSSSSSTKSWLFRLYYSTNPRKKPSEIPWQKKTANCVNLMGFIHQPLQFGADGNGNYWAATVLSQRTDHANTNLDQAFWIPIVFEGDLAQIAACHLKVKDHVHVSGSLVADSPSFTVKEEGQADFQVMVHDINFVQWSYEAKKAFTSDNPEKFDASGCDTSSDPWRDLLQSPENWLDHRVVKLNGSLNPKYPDFKHKSNGTSLWINKRTPKWALAGLNGSQVDVQVSNPTPEEIKDKGSYTYQPNPQEGE